MTELVRMTSNTGASNNDSVALLESRSTYAESLGGPAAVLLSTLLALQCANVAQAKVADVGPNSTLQVTTATRADLFDDLVEFHQRLATSQQDLPEDAARLLRENLWQLYD
jgi:hypothetical protein